MKKKAASITMVYNEPDFLPIWLRHNARQVGGDNCFVIDHGSDDGSTDIRRAASFIRLPRTAHDDNKRTELIGSIVSFLLLEYEVVFYTDVDEIIFADPRRFATLSEYCDSSRQKVVTAHGFELTHLRSAEKVLDLDSPILRQRSWVRFAAPMCKPVMVRKPVKWVAGFHWTLDEQPVFGDLYLFHLRWSDFDLALKRLQRTRAQPWADPNAGAWQRWPDEKYTDFFASFESAGRLEEVAFVPFLSPLSDAMDRFLENHLSRHDPRIDQGFWWHTAWQVPEAFRDVF